MSSETSICQAKKVLFKKTEKEAQSHLNPLTRRSHQAAGSVMLLSCEAPELRLHSSLQEPPHASLSRSPQPQGLLTMKYVQFKGTMKKSYVAKFL